MDDDLTRIEKTIRNFKLVVNGTDQIQGGFGNLPRADSTDQRIANVLKSFNEFQIVGGNGVNVQGSIHKGFAITVDKKAICGQVVTPVPTPTGACCLNDGSCLVTTSSTCASLGGTYKGDNVPCSPSPCPIGACCKPDGTCTITTEGGCTGVFQGVGTDCDPNPCPQPPNGACCIGMECSIQTESNCIGLGGTYQGNGTNCDVNPCTNCCMFYPGGGGLGNLVCDPGNPSRFWHQASCGFFNPNDGNFYRVWNGGTSYSDQLLGDPCNYCFSSVTVQEDGGGTFTFSVFLDGSECMTNCTCDVCTGPGSQIFIVSGEYSI